MNLQHPPVFTADAFPDADPSMLDMLNRGFQQIFTALVNVKDIQEAAGKKLTTSDTGTAYLDIKTDTLPTHLWVTDLERVDGQETAAPFSQTWVRRNGVVRLLFSGLSASTKYTCSVLYR